MKLVEGLLDYSQAPQRPQELFLFTGNSYIRRDGALVMGRGAAKTVKDMYPGIDHQLGREITHLGFYGMRIAIRTNIGVFRVKRHFSNDAELGLIEGSLVYLEEMAKEGPYNAIHMNFPGIGFGRLHLEQDEIESMLQKLSDKVSIYR